MESLGSQETLESVPWMHDYATAIATLIFRSWTEEHPWLLRRRQS